MEFFLPALTRVTCRRSTMTLKRGIEVGMLELWQTRCLSKTWVESSRPKLRSGLPALRYHELLPARSLAERSTTARHAQTHQGRSGISASLGRASSHGIKKPHKLIGRARRTLNSNCGRLTRSEDSILRLRMIMYAYTQTPGERPAKEVKSKLGSLCLHLDRHRRKEDMKWTRVKQETVQAPAAQAFARTGRLIYSPMWASVLGP